MGDLKSINYCTFPSFTSSVYDERDERAMKLILHSVCSLTGSFEGAHEVTFIRKISENTCYDKNNSYGEASSRFVWRSFGLHYSLVVKLWTCYRGRYARSITRAACFAHVEQLHWMFCLDQNTGPARQLTGSIDGTCVETARKIPTPLQVCSWTFDETRGRYHCELWDTGLYYFAVPCYTTASCT